MRKFAFVALMAIFFTTGSYAQEEEVAPQEEAIEKYIPSSRSSFTWGVKANVSCAWERKSIDNKSRTGFSAGVFTEFKLNEHLSIQPELLYTQQGSRQYVAEGLSESKGDVYFQFDYINLPVLLKIYVYNARLSIEVGPQFGYMTRHKEKREPKNKATQRNSIPSSWVNKFDISASLGTSYIFYDSSEVAFDLSVRFNYGFLKIYDKDAVKDVNRYKNYTDNKNSVLQFGIGARF